MGSENIVVDIWTLYIQERSKTTLFSYSFDISIVYMQTQVRATLYYQQDCLFSRQIKARIGWAGSCYECYLFHRIIREEPDERHDE